jgi:hypothetical protein
MPLQKVGYKVRNDEWVWLVPKDQQLTVYIGLGFEDQVDGFIAKLILGEMEEAKR